MGRDDQTSIWKKEISFRRKPKVEAAAAPPVVQEAPAANPAQTSIWKKEIGFRRKAKSEWVAVPPAAAPEPPAPVHEARPRDPVVPSVPPEVAPLVLPPMTPAAATPETSPPARALPPVSPEPSIDEAAVDEPEAGPSPADLPPVSPTAAPQVTEPQVTTEAAAALPTAAIPPAAATALEAPPDDTTASDVDATAPPEPGPESAPPATEPARSGRLRRRERNADTGSASTHNQLVGLKIGASQIAAAQVVNRGGPRIVRMARMPLERGVVVGGELREPEELASALKTFFKKNKLPRTNVRLGISNNRIGVRTFEITGIDDPQQLANAVRFRAQETLPIPLDEAVLDHRILEDKVGEDGVRVCRVLLVVAHRELVERYVGACRKAGLKLVGIDLEAFALLRALSDPDTPPGEDAAVVCVSIGHDRSTLAVSDGRVCEFTRVLAWGGSALDGALARVLDQTPSAVVPIKHALSLLDEGEAAGLDVRHADEARRAMIAELQSFARELVASLRFYQEQPNSLGIVEILVTGGAATCGGLAEELERLIGIPVRVADPLMRMKARKNQHEAGLPTASMAVAVGLGIDD
jgi:type IV pilus assembly protein PilM